MDSALWRCFLKIWSSCSSNGTVGLTLHQPNMQREEQMKYRRADTRGARYFSSSIPLIKTSIFSLSICTQFRVCQKSMPISQSDGLWLRQRFHVQFHEREWYGEAGKWNANAGHGNGGIGSIKSKMMMIWKKHVAYIYFNPAMHAYVTRAVD